MAKVLFRIIYSDEFINGLANVYEHHLSNKAEAKAARIVGSALRKIQHLKQNPLLFSKVESKKHSACRKIVVEEYIILYLVKDKVITIINIIAGATDWKKQQT